QARLRLTVSAAHTPEDVQEFLHASAPPTLPPVPLAFAYAEARLAAARADRDRARQRRRARRRSRPQIPRREFLHLDQPAWAQSPEDQRGDQTPASPHCAFVSARPGKRARIIACQGIGPGREARQSV